MRWDIIDEDLAWISEQPVPWHELSGARVLITGAYGFVPAYLAESLLYRNEHASAGCNVLALVRSREKAVRRFARYEHRPDLEFVVQDVCSPLKIDGPVDYIVHAASPASPRFYGSDPVGTLRPNVLGTHEVLALARQKGTRGVLYFSSAEVYGRVDPEHIPTPESYAGALDPMLVRSCYAESKRMGETLCAAWHHQYQVPVHVARIFHTYGPGMALDDGRVFADFVRDVVEGRDIRLNSAGTHRRAFCYVADAVVALWKVLLEGSAGKAFNVGNDEAETSVFDLARLVAGLFPEKGIRVSRAVEPAVTGYIASSVDRACPDTSRLRGLGWKPRFSLTDGFRRTILSYMGTTDHA